MKKYLENFSYVIPLYSSYEPQSSKLKYHVIPSLSMRDTDKVKLLPVPSFIMSTKNIARTGSLTLFEVLNAVLVDTFTGSHDFTYGHLVQTLLNFSYPFDNLEFRFITHDDIRQFDVIITPLTYVDDQSLDDVEK